MSSQGESGRAPRLLEQLEAALVLRHYSARTVEAYSGWVRRFVVFHGRRHPSELGAAEVTGFLSHLATDKQVSASTQNQALAALLFLYAHVLKQPLDRLTEVAHARRPARLPTVMTRAEVAKLLEHMKGTPQLMASLMYGAGLRLQECVQLRVKDVDLETRQLVLEGGRGRKIARRWCPVFWRFN